MDEGDYVEGNYVDHDRRVDETALVLVHPVKGVVGEVDTPFNRMFRHRAEETGIIGVQERLLAGFGTAKAKVVYTAPLGRRRHRRARRRGH